MNQFFYRAGLIYFFGIISYVYATDDISNNSKGPGKRPANFLTIEYPSSKAPRTTLRLVRLTLQTQTPQREGLLVNKENEREGGEEIDLEDESSETKEFQYAYPTRQIFTENDVYVDTIDLRRLKKLPSLELMLKVFPKHPFQLLNSASPTLLQSRAVLNSKGIGLREERLILALSCMDKKKERANIIKDGNSLTALSTRPNEMSEFLKSLKELSNQNEKSFFETLYENTQTFEKKKGTIKKYVIDLARKSPSPTDVNNTDNTVTDDIVTASIVPITSSISNSMTHAPTVMSSIPPKPNGTNLSGLIAEVFSIYPYLTPAMLCTKILEKYPDVECEMEDVQDFYTEKEWITSSELSNLNWRKIFQYWFENKTEENERKGLVNRLILEKNKLGEIPGRELLNMYTELQGAMTTYWPKQINTDRDFYIQLIKDTLDLQKMKVERREKK